MTWNPVTGCSKVSQGCKNCYAERLAARLQAMGSRRYRNGFAVTIHEDALLLPMRWSKPRLVFVNSMSDLFHEKVPLEFTKRVFEVMARCQHHTFQVLTKRSERLRRLGSEFAWSENIWMGVSIENSQVLHRLEDLLHTPAKVRFLSLEPLIGPLDRLPLNGIDWVIVGGESGPKARPMKKDWVLSILQQCRTSRVPFFFKQWGGVRKHKSGRTLDGETYDEMPARVSAMPT